MTDHLPDFPHDELPEDEISKKNAPSRTSRKPRGKSFLGKILFLLLIAAIIFGGIFYIQQSLLDLEAQAQVYALQTVSASSITSSIEVTLNPPPPSSPFADSTLTVEAMETPSAAVQATITSTPQ
jgi:hypothetical protein